jgi:hypothetical protein
MCNLTKKRRRTRAAVSGFGLPVSPEKLLYAGLGAGISKGVNVLLNKWTKADNTPVLKGMALPVVAAKFLVSMYGMTIREDAVRTAALGAGAATLLEGLEIITTDKATGKSPFEPLIGASWYVPGLAGTTITRQSPFAQLYADTQETFEPVQNL